MRRFLLVVAAACSLSLAAAQDDAEYEPVDDAATDAAAFSGTFGEVIANTAAA